MFEFIGMAPSAELVLLLGVLSGVLSALAFAPYIVDTARGRTRPERASWLIWSVLGSIAVASQIAEGVGTGLIFAVVQVAGTTIIFVLSIRQGNGDYLCRRNRIILPIAALGVALWWWTDVPAMALGLSILISLLAGAVTLWKAFRDPKSETLLTWAVSLVASVLAVLVVDGRDWVVMAYPLYLLTLYAGIVLAIVLGRMTGQTGSVVWASRRGAVVKMPPMLPARQIPGLTEPTFRRSVRFNPSLTSAAQI